MISKIIQKKYQLINNKLITLFAYFYFKLINDIVIIEEKNKVYEKPKIPKTAFEMFVSLNENKMRQINIISIN